MHFARASAEHRVASGGAWARRASPLSGGPVYSRLITFWPNSREERGNPAFPDLGGLGCFDAGDMLALETIGETVKSGSGLRVGIQRLGEVRRRAHYSRFGVKLQTDLNGVTLANPARGAVRSADSD